MIYKTTSNSKNAYNLSKLEYVIDKEQLSYSNKYQPK